MLMNISNKKKETNKFSILLILCAIFLGFFFFYLILCYIIELKINNSHIIVIILTFETTIINFIENLNIITYVRTKTILGRLFEKLFIFINNSNNKAILARVYSNIRGNIAGKIIKLFMPLIDYIYTKPFKIPLLNKAMANFIIWGVDN
jgi:hypothetical protein